MKKIIFLIFLSLSSALNAQLVNVTEIHKDKFLFDIKYATADNFTGKKIYDSSECFLERTTLDALLDAHSILQNMYPGLTFLIYDCYREPAAQALLWAAKPDARYVAPPEKGSRHSRGTAIDLTIANKEDGTPIKMPTAYDYFGYKAYMTATAGLTQEEIDNRDLLKNIMSAAGFGYTRTEWWHYDGPNACEYPIIDKKPI